MDNSPLHRLAPELRNRIYELSLTTSEGITLDCSDSAMAFSIPATTKLPSIALTQVCREVREESRKMYFSINPLTIVTSASTGLLHAKHFPTWDVRSAINAFRRRIGKEAFDEIRTIKFTIQAHKVKYAPMNVKRRFTFDRQMVRNIRSTFSPAAQFEVHFDMKMLPRSEPSMHGVKLDVMWDIDQTWDHFRARLLTAKEDGVVKLPPSHIDYTTRKTNLAVRSFLISIEALVLLGYDDSEWT